MEDQFLKVPQALKILEKISDFELENRTASPWFSWLCVCSGRWSVSPGGTTSTCARSTPPSSSWWGGSPTWRCSGGWSKRAGSRGTWEHEKDAENHYFRYQDILQGDFFEDYFLLAYKSLTWMLWSKMKCSQVGWKTREYCGWRQSMNYLLSY